MVVEAARCPKLPKYDCSHMGRPSYQIFKKAQDLLAYSRHSR